MRRWVPHALIVAGSMLCMAPLVGATVTVLGMVRAFGALSSSGSGTPDAMASDIGDVLSASFYGLVAWPVGLLMLIGGAVWLSRRRNRSAAPGSGPA